MVCKVMNIRRKGSYCCSCVQSLEITLEWGSFARETDFTFLCIFQCWTMWSIKAINLIKIYNIITNHNKKVILRTAILRIHLAVKNLSVNCEVKAKRVVRVHFQDQWVISRFISWRQRFDSLIFINFCKFIK